MTRMLVTLVSAEVMRLAALDDGQAADVAAAIVEACAARYDAERTQRVLSRLVDRLDQLAGLLRAALPAQAPTN